MPVRITTSRIQGVTNINCVDLEADDQGDLNILQTTAWGEQIAKIKIGPMNNHTIDSLRENLERLRIFVRD